MQRFQHTSEGKTNMFYLFCFYQTAIIPSGSTSVSSTLTSQTTAAPFLFPQYPPDDAFFLVKSSLVETVQASAVQVKGNVT